VRIITLKDREIKSRWAAATMPQGQPRGNEVTFVANG